jgi:hypothetical protein
MHEAPRGATRAQNCLMKRQGGGRIRPRGCAVVPANIAGLFRLLPGIGREKTDATSPSERESRKPAQAPMPAHMGLFAEKCNRNYCALQKPSRAGAVD